MLTLPLMAALGLGIVWVNTLLVVGAAWQDLRVLRARLARARKAAVGTLERGNGPGGCVAVHRVEQVGRALEGSVPTITFADRAYASEVFDGMLRRDDGSRMAIVPASAAEVWPSEEARQRAMAAGTVGYVEARGPKGMPRTVEMRVGATERAWVVAGDGGPAWVSAIDPVRWCSQRITRVTLFVAGSLLLAAALTVVACVPPAFGLVSKLGATGLLAFFLLVQPAGVSVRESVRPEHERIARGERSAEGQSAVAA